MDFCVRNTDPVASALHPSGFERHSRAASVSLDQRLFRAQQHLRKGHVWTQSKDTPVNTSPFPPELGRFDLTHETRVVENKDSLQTEISVTCAFYLFIFYIFFCRLNLSEVSPGRDR